MSITKLFSKTRGWRFKPMVEIMPGKFMRSHTHGTKIEAKEEELELRTLKKKGAGAYALAPLPFSDGAESWLQDLVRRASYAHAKKTRQCAEKYFLPYFGARDMKTIRPSDISEFMSAVEKKDLSGNSINAILRSLKAMFNFLIEDDMLPNNPVKRKHKVQVAQKENIVWTVEEARKILDYVDAKYIGERRWVYLVYCIAFNTGCRAGEIFPLETADVDFSFGRIRISKSFCNVSKKVKTPKNGKSRYVPLSSKLAQELRKYIVDNHTFGALFLDSEGDYRSYYRFNDLYNEDVKAAGVRKTKFHNIRRFFITNFVENGGNEAQLRKIVGHGSVEMTNLYTSQHQDMTRLAEIINL